MGLPVERLVEGVTEAPGRPGARVPKKARGRKRGV
jgi:hypothetical protein